MNHIWIVTKDGWQCSICKELVPYQFQVPEPPEDAGPWLSKEFLLDSHPPSPRLVYKTATKYTYYASPINQPPYEACEKAKPIERMIMLKNDIPYYITSLDDWNKLARVVPDLLSLLLEVDRLLENSLQAKAEALIKIREAKIT